MLDALAAAQDESSVSCPFDAPATACFGQCEPQWALYTALLFPSALFEASHKGRMATCIRMRKTGLMARDGGKVGLTFYWGTLRRTADSDGARGKESGNPSLGAEVPRSCEEVRWLGGTSEPSTSFHYVAGIGSVHCA